MAAAPPAPAAPAAAPAVVCFACVKNAGRSQMSAAFFNALVDPACARAISAGSAPAEEVHPEVVVVMKEVGIDLSGAVPTKLTAELLTQNGATLVITMGCGDRCPYVPGVEILDWKVDDPHGQADGAVRVIRDGLSARVAALAEARGWRTCAAAAAAAGGSSP